MPYLLCQRALLWLLSLVSPTVRRLRKRLAASPGIPAPDPCPSYWVSPPSPIAKHGSEPGAMVPKYADVLIIGSGITGTSVARTILDRGKEALVVVMLEARDACSGATGRNGGHITPVLYQEYSELKKEHGAEVAREIMRFRLSHLSELLAVASEENLLEDSQCRETRSYDVYQDNSLYHNAKQLLDVFKRDLPVEGNDLEIIENKAALQDLQLVPSVVGCIASRGGAVHPYRLVTGILERLLRCYSSRFHLLTHTPCTGIVDAEDGYSVSTPRGEIRARQVVHATNAWVAHLLPGMRGKVVPARGVMTAQKPGPKQWGDGTRSFVMYSGSSYRCFDYLTQQASGELMLGGGFFRDRAYMTEVGNADDGGWNRKVGEYLGTEALKQYFEIDSDGGAVESWGGILGMSADGQPWVGRVPGKLSGRAGNGEWVAAGYSGEGMVHAWLCGQGVGEEVGGGGDGDGAVGGRAAGPRRVEVPGMCRVEGRGKTSCQHSTEV